MRKRLWLLFLIVCTVLLVTIVNTYALFETNADGKMTANIAAWVIKLNDILISEEQKDTFSVNNFVYTPSSTTADGVIAPGRNGYFDLILDPTGTDVAIRYDIEFDFSTYYSGGVTSTVAPQDGTYVIKTGPNTYSGVFTLDDMKKSSTTTLRINVEWDNIDEYDEDDTKLGITKDGKIRMPVSINVVQYFGEEIVEYEEENEESGEEPGEEPGETS